MDGLLKGSIIKTLAYFDIFEHPLTKEELYRALWKGERVDFNDFVIALEASVDSGGTHEKWSYYFLPLHQKFVETRRRRTPIVEHKMAVARKGIRKLRWIPFVRTVFVCNTVAAGHPDPASDIDVFIVVRHGRLWLTRFLATVVLSLFGLRRHGKKITDRICLSFYVTDQALNLEPIALLPSDIYLVYWIAQLVPVYDPDHLYDEMQRVNQWARAYVAMPPSYDLLKRWRVDDTKISYALKGIFEKMWEGRYGDLLESQAKGFQAARMKARENMRGGASSHVIINDTMMKFHENDRREQYREEWINRVRARAKMPENFPAS